MEYLKVLLILGFPSRKLRFYLKDVVKESSFLMIVVEILFEKQHLSPCHDFRGLLRFMKFDFVVKLQNLKIIFFKFQELLVSNSHCFSVSPSKEG